MSSEQLAAGLVNCHPVLTGLGNCYGNGQAVLINGLSQVYRSSPSVDLKVRIVRFNHFHAVGCLDARYIGVSGCEPGYIAV